MSTSIWRCLRVVHKSVSLVGCSAIGRQTLFPWEIGLRCALHSADLQISQPQLEKLRIALPSFGQPGICGNQHIC